MKIKFCTLALLFSMLLNFTNSVHGASSFYDHSSNTIEDRIIHIVTHNDGDENDHTDPDPDESETCSHETVVVDCIVCNKRKAHNPVIVTDCIVCCETSEKVSNDHHHTVATTPHRPTKDFECPEPPAQLARAKINRPKAMGMDEVKAPRQVRNSAAIRCKID